MKVVIVYLGEELPKYVIRNLDYLRTKFPQESVYFISDNPSSLDLVSKIGVKTWLFVEDKLLRMEIESKSDLPMNFRKGFWYSTTARFFALQKFMQTIPHEPIIQIEADVWLSDLFPFGKFKNLPPEVQIAFPLESENTGVASILYLKDLESANLLVEVTREQQAIYKSVSDMQILGTIYVKCLMNTLVLPTATKNSMSITSGASQRVRDDICKNIEYFGGIFDGTTYGLYIFGEDPRNHRGRIITHRNQEHHLIQCSQSKFIINHDSIGIMESGFVQIFNLHVHSKNKNAWDDGRRMEIYSGFIKNLGQEIHGERDWLLTAKLAFISLSRRLNSLKR